MTLPDHQRKDAAARALIERQALAFHYETCRKTGEPAFSPDAVFEVLLGGGVGVVYMASPGARCVALYSMEPADIGYRFRRLSNEYEGREVRPALLAATDGKDPVRLAHLGLSMREISRITGFELKALRVRLAHV